MTEATDTSSSVLNRIVQQVQDLYTLPAVALEVVKLTGEPKIDCRKLKQAIELDPALTCKILRFVNSSIYGLSREVGDLQEALAILGTNTLKLLVLGFSLPSNLLSGIDKSILSKYWRLSLTKGVAARELSRVVLDEKGDEAFIGGMLQHVGMLALIQQIGNAYVQFLTRVWDEKADIRRLEVASMGFDHSVLTSRLLEAWYLPPELVHAVGLDISASGLPTLGGDSVLIRSIHLAELATQLLTHEMDDQLSELQAAAEEYHGGPVPQLDDALESIEEQVNQLASLLDLELSDATCYSDVLARARQRLTELAELSAHGDRQTVASLKQGRPTQSPPDASDDSPSEADEQVAETKELGRQIRKLFGNEPVKKDTRPFLAPRTAEDSLRHLETVERIANRAQQADGYQGYSPDGNHPGGESDLYGDYADDIDVESRLEQLIAHCRGLRRNLSLALIEIDSFQDIVTIVSPQQAGQLDDFLEKVIERMYSETAEVVRISDGRLALLMDEEFEVASEQMRTLKSVIERWTDQRSEKGQNGMTLSIGLASTGIPPKNFTPETILERADRCLSAAQHFGGNTIKRIVF